MALLAAEAELASEELAMVSTLLRGPDGIWTFTAALTATPKDSSHD